MAIYSQGFRTTNFTSNQACLEIRTTSTDRVYVLEIGYVSATATGQTIGLGRPAAIGITPANTAFQQEDPSGPNSTINGALSWGTSPTAPSVYMRRTTLPATIGAGVVWTFPRGLIIPISSSLVIFNISATVASDCWVVIDQ